MTRDDPPRFPVDCAFVIQFAHPHSGVDPHLGRIEHVVSGRARRFRDETQLMTFVAEVLASPDSDTAAAAQIRPR